MSEEISEKDRLHRIMDNMRNMRFWKRTQSQAKPITPLEHLQATIAINEGEKDPTVKAKLRQEENQLLGKSVRRGAKGGAIMTAAAVGAASIMNAAVPAVGAGLAKAGETIGGGVQTAGEMAGEIGRTTERMLYSVTSDQEELKKRLAEAEAKKEGFDQYIVLNHPDLVLNNGQARVRSIPLVINGSPGSYLIGSLAPGQIIKGVRYEGLNPDTHDKPGTWIGFSDPSLNTKGDVGFIEQTYVQKVIGQPK